MMKSKIQIRNTKSEYRNKFEIQISNVQNHSDVFNTVELEKPEVRISKLDATLRNNLQRSKRTNSNDQIVKFKTDTGWVHHLSSFKKDVLDLRILNLGFVSDFVLRISNF